MKPNYPKPDIKPIPTYRTYAEIGDKIIALLETCGRDLDGSYIVPEFVREEVEQLWRKLDYKMKEAITEKAIAKWNLIIFELNKKEKK